MFQFATLRHPSYGAYLNAKYKAENYSLQVETLNLERSAFRRGYICGCIVIFPVLEHNSLDKYIYVRVNSRASNGDPGFGFGHQ
jgi:hypothetical protein